MGIEQHKRAKEYIKDVCSQIKNKEMHEEIILELESHITELYEEYLSKSLSEDEAIDKAVSQMGDSLIVGIQLNEIYKPKFEWSIFIITLLLAGAGLISIYFIEVKDVLYRSPSFMFNKSLFFSLLGIAAAIGLYFFDYRKIKPYSKYIYSGTLLILFVVLFMGSSVNGLRYFRIGPVSINFVEISPFLLAFSLAGIFDGWNWNNPKKALFGFLMLIVPVILMLAYPSFSAAVTYSIVFTVLIVVSGVRMRYAILLSVSGIGMFLLSLIYGPSYRLQRFLTFINPEKDPLGSGYIYIQIKKMLQSSGLLGQGFTFESITVPEIHTDFIFTYIVYTFGWAAGILLIALFICFVLRITTIAKTVKNNYGRLLSSGFASLFTVQFLWNILMTLGLAPISGVSLPFISYGGSQFILNMAAVGLISSIYRRKNMQQAIKAYR